MEKNILEVRGLAKNYPGVAALKGIDLDIRHNTCLLYTSGEPMILGGPESEPFAKTDSAIKKTKNIPVFMVPEEEYPNATISSFAEVFDEIGIKGKSQKLGVVGLDKICLLYTSRCV